MGLSVRYTRMLLHVETAELLPASNVHRVTWKLAVVTRYLVGPRNHSVPDTRAHARTRPEQRAALHHSQITPIYTWQKSTQLSRLNDLERDSLAAQVMDVAYPALGFAGVQKAVFKTKVGSPLAGAVPPQQRSAQPRDRRA